MTIAVRNKGFNEKEMAIDALYSELDKGIDDMENDKVKEIDKAFRIIKDKVLDEL